MPCGPTRDAFAKCEAMVTNHFRVQASGRPQHKPAGVLKQVHRCRVYMHHVTHDRDSLRQHVRHIKARVDHRIDPLQSGQFCNPGSQWVRTVIQLGPRWQHRVVARDQLTHDDWCGLAYRTSLRREWRRCTSDCRQPLGGAPDCDWQGAVINRRHRVQFRPIARIVQPA